MADPSAFRVDLAYTQAPCSFQGLHPQPGCSLTALSVGSSFFPPLSLSANSFLVLLLCGLLTTKVLVLPALLMLLICGAPASGTGLAWGLMEQGEASLLGERGCRTGVAKDHTDGIISIVTCINLNCLTPSVSPHSCGCYKPSFPFTFRCMPLGHVHPQQLGCPVMRLA